MELAQSIYIPDFEHEIPATAIPELPSWDFLESLDVEASNTDNFRLPESAKAEQAKERLKEKNRQAQKRARQRNKVALIFIWMLHSRLLASESSV